MNIKINKYTCAAYVLALALVLIPGQSFPAVYSTWETLEPDKCASAWLLKRFVDKDAEFQFFPSGELITSGVPFDTPDAEFRRYHNISTFESILMKYKIADSVLVEMGEILHDIEVNSWGEKKRAESSDVIARISEITGSNSDSKIILIKSFEYFDIIYKKIKGRQHGNE